MISAPAPRDREADGAGGTRSFDMRTLRPVTPVDQIPLKEKLRQAIETKERYGPPEMRGAREPVVDLTLFVDKRWAKERRDRLHKDKTPDEH